MKTTVIVLNYNGERFLQPLMEALDDENCYVLVADNNSQDNSKAVFHQFRPKHPDRFEWVGYPDNLGFAKGNNRAVKRTNTDNILFLNNDTLPKKGFIKAMEKRLNKKYPIVGAKLIYAEDSEKTVPYDDGEFTFRVKGGMVQHAGIDFYPKGMPYEMGRTHRPQDRAVNQPKEVPAVTAACMMIKKSVFDFLDGFDEDFINGWEDTSLCLEAKEKGYKCFYAPNAEVMHYASASEGRFLKEQYNKDLYEEKWIKSGRFERIL